MQTRLCKNCGSPFESHIANKLYCDASCRIAATWPKGRRTERAPQVCTECEATFTPDSAHQHRCRPCINANRLPPGQRPDPNWRNAECPTCGEGFQKDAPQQVYCSAECRKASRRVERQCRTCSAPFHPVASQQYCKNCRPRALRRKPRLYAVHKADKCSRCGFVPEHTCQLDIHHADGDPENNEPSNLETLCANCHRLESLGPRKQAA